MYAGRDGGAYAETSFGNLYDVPSCLYVFHHLYVLRLISYFLLIAAQLWGCLFWNVRSMKLGETRLLKRYQNSAITLRYSTFSSAFV